MVSTPRQEARAHEITRLLTGGRYSHGVWKSILALVIADEKPGPTPTEYSGAPAPGARQVLKQAERAKPVVPKDPDQGQLW